MLKILMILVIMVFIITSAYYTDMLTWMWDIITSINSWFIAYIPLELRILLTLIVFSIMVWLAYAFIS